MSERSPSYRPSRPPPGGGRPVPRVPFDRWPVQVYDPAFGFVWYTQPATLVTQMSIVHGTLASARVIQDHIDLVLAHRAAEIAAEGGLFLLHDWRAATGYDSDARQQFMERLRARPRDYMRGAVTCVVMTPLVGMAAQAGSLVATMVTGKKTEIAADPAPILRTWNVQAPQPGAPFPGRQAG